jgi:hypothetical protein
VAEQQRTPEPELVELVAAVIHRRDCNCGAWDDASREQASDVLAALAEAGRLLPADAPVEWSVRFADGTVMSQIFTEEGARAHAALYTAAVDDPAEPVWRRVGPWQPASSGEEQ